MSKSLNSKFILVLTIAIIIIAALFAFVFFAFPQKVQAQSPGGPPGPPSSLPCVIYNQDLQSLKLELENLVNKPFQHINRTDVRNKLNEIENLLQATPSYCNCQTQSVNALTEINQLLNDVFQIPKNSLKNRILDFFIPVILNSLSTCLSPQQPPPPPVGGGDFIATLRVRIAEQFDEMIDKEGGLVNVFKIKSGRVFKTDVMTHSYVTNLKHSSYFLSFWRGGDLTKSGQPALNRALR